MRGGGLPRGPILLAHAQGDLGLSWSGAALTSASMLAPDLGERLQVIDRREQLPVVGRGHAGR